MSNRVCLQYAAYGKEKSRMSHLIKLAQKVPTANLEDVLPLAEDLTEILSRCCESTSEDCMARELPEHTLKICGNLSKKNSKFQECCYETTPMGIFMCSYFMPTAEPVQLPAIQLPTSKDLCGQSATQAMDQYTFELSRRTQVPEVFLSKVLETTLKTLRECCDTQDSVSCFSTQSPLMKRQLTSFIEKGQEMCADYSENTFTEYKKKLAERLRTKTPNASTAELEDMVAKHSDFASKCCSMNSPPFYCSSQIDAEMRDILQS